MQNLGEIQEMTLRDHQGNIVGYRDEERFGDVSVDMTNPYCISHFPSGLMIIMSHEMFNREEVKAVAVEIAPFFDDMPGDKVLPSMDNPEYAEWAKMVKTKLTPYALQLWDFRYEDKSA
jgi:hypothetical protein